jgi:signal transduction histidine kinase
MSSIVSTERSQEEAAVTGARPGTLAPTSGAFSAEVLPKLRHELRSPLVGIVGLTRVLLMQLDAGPPDAARQARQLEMIHASAVRSLATIEQVVDLARIDAGKIQPAFRLIDCRGVIADVAAERQEAATQRGLCLRAEIPGQPVLVTSDPKILAPLLRELADNALRFTDAGEVRVRLRAHDEPVVIEVADDGPGIPVEEQARIFGPFERGERAAERHDGAAGLGLYLACVRAGLLGLQLSLASQAGSGSIFSITFPAGPQGSDHHPSPEPRS